MSVGTCPDRHALLAWGARLAKAVAGFDVDVGEAMSAERPLESVLVPVCSQVAAAAGADRASVFLFEDDALVPATACFAGGDVDRSFRRRGATPSAAGTAADWAAWLGATSAVLLPLGRGPDDLGLVVCDARRPDAFDARHVAIASGLTAQAAVIIEWAQFVEQFDTTMATATATRRLLEGAAGATGVEEAATVVVRVLSEALGTERNAVLYFPEPDVVKIATVDMPPDLDDALRRALDGAERSPHFDDTRTLREPRFHDEDEEVRPGGLIETLGVRGWAGIPLLCADGLVGHVLCGDATRARHWSRRDRRLASDLAGEAALIIDAARLREADRAHRDLLAYQANHDHLTGLPNRRLLLDRLTDALAFSRRDRSPCAVMLADLNHFKDVNDALGHHRGDELLAGVVGRLAVALRGADLAARWGGDEFAILLPRTDAEGAVAVAERIGDALVPPMPLGDLHVEVSASLGIAVFPDHGDSAEDLLRCADAAMYAAKRAHRAYELYGVGA